MAHLIDQIHARLSTDPILVGTVTGVGMNDPYTGILSGGFYRQPLKRESPGATPHAFSGVTGAPRPAGIVRESATAPVSGRFSILGTYRAYFHINLFAPSVQSGKEAIHNAEARIRTLLDGWITPTDSGYMAFFTWEDQTGILDNEEILGAIFNSVRYAAVSRWSNTFD